jgi:ribosomal protein L37E
MKSDFSSETVPCKRCGEPTSYLGTKLCNNCWEVEHRLDLYLRSEKAQQYIHSKLCDLRYETIEVGIGKKDREANGT